MVCNDINEWFIVIFVKKGIQMAFPYASQWLMMVNDDGQWWLMGYLMGFHSHGGTPYSWMVSFMENPIQMDDWGYPYFSLLKEST